MVPLKFEYGDGTKRQKLLMVLAAQKIANPKYSIIDVGASDNPWSSPVIDATLDLRPNEVCSGNIRPFLGDINIPSGWLEVMAHVELYGKFDYAICTHTLEDVINPEVSLKMLPQIAKAGFIATPSLDREMTRNLEGPWKGYIHHRWIFKENGDTLLLIPKIPYVEFLKDHSGEDGDKAEIRIYWEGKIKYKLLNDGYLGPNVQRVKEMYEEVLR